MNRGLDQPKGWLQIAALMVGAGFLYYLTARFGLEFSYRHTHASPVWPSAGLAVASMVLLGWRVWPGVWLGAFAANAIPWILNEGAPPYTALWVSAAIATGNAIEALAAWWLWQNWLGSFVREGGEMQFSEGPNVFRLAALSLLSCIPSAFIGPGAVCAGGVAAWSQFPLIWVIWLTGEASSLLLFAPFLIAWSRPLKIRWNLARAAEGIAAFGALAVGVWAVFGGWLFIRGTTFLITLPLLWIVVRLSPRAVVSGLVFLTAYAIWFTDHREGPFARPSEHEAMLLMMIYLWVAGLTCMVLAASVAARKKSEATLKNLANELEERVEARTTELNKTIAAFEEESRQRELAAEEARRNQERFLLFMQNVPGAAFIKDLDGIYVYANEEMRHFQEQGIMEWIGRSDHELWPKEVADPLVAHDRRVVQSRQPLRVVESVPREDGPHEWLVNKFPLLDANGNVESVAGLAVDITDLKRAEERIQAALEREAILRREINHRVKNNLQVISSLLYLQSTKVDDLMMRELLRESQSRVRSLALIYDRLCQRGEVAGIAFAEYMEQLAREVFVAYQVRKETITLKIKAEEVFLDLDTALPCGLILTELISNALKYAFPGNRRGEVSIELSLVEGEQFCLTVCDNGIGLPEGFKLGMAKSMGVGLVRDLTRQLEGQIEFLGEGGTTVKVIFPAPKAQIQIGAPGT